MKRSFSRRTLLSLFILGVALLSAYAIFFHIPVPAFADKKTLIGTWSVQTQFTSGPMTGQTKTGTITYYADGTLTSKTDDGMTGTGTWTQTTKWDFHYEFKEQIYQNGHNIGYIDVVEDGTFARNGKTNTAQGSGTFTVYTPGGPRPVAVNDTTSTHTRIS